MTRPFAPRDTLRLRSQQAEGAVLELEADVLVGRSPLRQAFLAYCRCGDRGVETLILDPQEGPLPSGFVQARRRLDPCAADVIFVSPSLDAGNGVALGWHRLLADACQWLAARGVQRIYAAIGEDDRIALHVLRQLGFVVYTSDVVLRRPPGPLACAPPEGMTLVAAGATLAHDIERLLTRSQPRSVRDKEGAQSSDWSTYPLGGRYPGSVTTRAWLDSRGELLGAWRVVAGRSGLWLRLVVGEAVDPEPAVRASLLEMEPGTRYGHFPTYVAVRGHEPALNLALREHGFEPVQGRFRLVKHTTARILEPAWRRRTLRERGLDPAPTHSTRLADVGPIRSRDAAL